MWCDWLLCSTLHRVIHERVFKKLLYNISCNDVFTSLDTKFGLRALAALLLLSWCALLSDLSLPHRSECAQLLPLLRAECARCALCKYKAKVHKFTQLLPCQVERSSCLAVATWHHQTIVSGQCAPLHQESTLLGNGSRGRVCCLDIQRHF